MIHTDDNLLPKGNMPSGHRVGWVFLLIFFFLAFGIVAVGCFSYWHYEQNFRRAAERQLLTITDLKVNELARWRAERLADCDVLYNYPAFSQLVRRSLDQPADEEAQQYLRAWLEKIYTNYDYSRLVLLDARSVERLTIPVRSGPMADISEQFDEVLRSGQVMFMDFHRNASGQSIGLGVLVPVSAESNGSCPLGVLVLEIDPSRYLYPFIQSWPVPSDSAETLLVRRDGDNVLFLNELRFQTNTALNLRIPLTDTNVPAVMAVLGSEGIVKGRDYRGEPTVAAVRAVPDSPWFMVARQDTAEMFAPVRERLGQIVLMIGVLLFGAGAMVGLVWRHQRLRFYRRRAILAEELQTSNRDLEQFAYVASHDLQEPLRMVANYMQLLERRYKDQLDQDAKDFIGFAVDGAVRMQQLIDSLLEYSRLHSRKKPFGPVDLNRVLQRVLRDLEGRILDADARVSFEPLPRVVGDAVQLGLVFQNLISNALKFRGQAAPEVHIAAKESSRHWEITIRDNGIGIEPEHHARIFNIFQRLHGRTEYSGTGIGLAICKRIIERHHGEAGVSSELGKGSTFWFILPKKGEE